MTGLKVGDSFPEGVAFSYVPYTPENGDITSCGTPQMLKASEGTQRSTEKEKRETKKTVGANGSEGRVQE